MSTSALLIASNLSATSEDYIGQAGISGPQLYAIQVLK